MNKPSDSAGMHSDKAQLNLDFAAILLLTTHAGSNRLYSINKQNAARQFASLLVDEMAY